MSLDHGTQAQFDSLEDMIVATAEMVRPSERLDVAQAALKYRILNTPQGYVGPWTHENVPYMVEPMEELTSLDFTGWVFVGPAQCAKALSLDTPLATPSGWTTMGDIKSGMEVFDNQGHACTVTGVSSVFLDHDCYRVVFDDQTDIVADAGHLWAVDDIYGAPKVITTEAIACKHRLTFKNGKWRSRFAVPQNQPIYLPEADLPIPPYVLGYWLANGNRHGSYLTAQKSDAEEIKVLLEQAGAEVYDVADKQENTRTFGVRVVGVFLLNLLESLGLGGLASKSIPPAYLRGSIEQRKALLRGLMDGDGSALKTGASTYCTIEPLLHIDMRELLWSLGVKHKSSTSQPKYSYLGETRVGKPAVRISFTAYREFEGFGLARKLQRLPSQGDPKSRPTHVGRRWIVSVEKISSVPVRCIAVDSPSRLFLAGAQMVPTHNTELGLNFLNYTAICDPADMMLLQPTQAASRDFAKRRVERLFRHSPEIGRRVMTGRQNQNIFDTKFRSGMLFTLSWPTISELSGKPIPRLWLSDYDRMPQNVDEEGSPFDLARKRATTFKRYGMTAAESSPGFTVENPKWVAATKHEAAPTQGILALYNRGDRRRWYWPCAGCGEPFEPDFSLLSYPDSEDEMEAAEQAVLFCPACGFTHTHEPTKGSPGKVEMNLRARWIGEGQRMVEGNVLGKRVRSDIASWWLKGPAAAFSSWKDLVLNFLKARKEYIRTGSEEALKTTVNVDQGLPYTPQAMASGLLPENLKAAAKQTDIGVVPEGVRFLIATIDVQKNCFVVQVHGFGVAGEAWIIDRYEIRKSERLDGDKEHYWVSPGSYPEDWHLLVEQAILKTYPLDDGSGRHMQIKAVASDSGGREGVTANAYAFWRWLRDPKGCKVPNLHRRFHLLRGDPTPKAQRWRLTYPDANRKDRHSGARGDVPVIAVGSNMMKDQVYNMLNRADEGGGHVNFPAGLPDGFYEELTAEERTPKGWDNPRRLRNEGWDLLVYAVTLTISQFIQIERIDWNNPPGWAKPWDTNDLVFTPEDGRRFLNINADHLARLAKLAEQLA